MNAIKKAHEIRKAAAKKFSCKLSLIDWAACLRMAHRGEELIMSKITYKIKKNGPENTFFDFRVEDADEALLEQIKGCYEQSAKLSFCPQYTFIRHLVVECDQDNKYNPDQGEIARNKEIVELLLDMAAVAA
jgi:hypothetical protein